MLKIGIMGLEDWGNGVMVKSSESCIYAITLFPTPQHPNTPTPQYRNTALTHHSRLEYAE
jgi:hypothetical protein